MSSRRHATTPLAAIAAAFLSAAAFAAPAPPAASPAGPRLPGLAVIVSIDGLNWNRLADYRPYFTGGLRRLLDEGYVEQESRYRHLNTETAPGHAALGTGAPPRVTGIIVNQWFAPKPDGTLGGVYCTDQVAVDPATGERTVFPGPASLRVPTLGDRLVEKYPSSRVVAVSGKDRGAIYLAGKSRNHSVYWFDTEAGRFVSSAAYDTKAQPGAAVAAIVGKYNRKSAGGQLPGRFGLTWKRLAAPFPALLEEGAAKPVPSKEMAAYQYPSVGLGWEHDLTQYSGGYFGGIFYSPLVDELVADVAVEILADKSLALGRRDTPDLLCLSFSGQDTVSHNYGPESEENLDVLRRLDLQLGRVLQELDRVVPGRVVLALSADHGFAPIPEAARKRDPKFQGGRVPYGSYTNTGFLARLNRAVGDALCLDPGAKPVFGIDGFNLKYDVPALPLIRTAAGPCGAAGRAVTADDLDRVIPGIIRTIWGEEFSEVLLVSKKDSWDPGDPAVEFARNDLDPERSGEVMLIPRQGVLMGWDPARGTGHGSHFESDIHVPLIFWGAGIPRKVSAVPSTPYGLAPTLGSLLDVKVPDSIGRALLGK